MKILARVCLVAGLLALGYWAFEFGGARLFQATESRRFLLQRQQIRAPAATDTARSPEAATVPAIPPAPAAGSAVALLSIPRLDLSLLVVEGASEKELKLGPGHVPGTAMPGAGGNFAVAAHRDTFFRPLRWIRRNDAIVVQVRDRDYHYRVASTEIVQPRDTQVLQPSGHETLTLITCYPFGFIGAAPQRFVVQADCLDCPPVP